MNGEDAIAGAIQRYTDLIYAVPGYPVTGLAERVNAEGVINEKVAVEYALGDSLSGRRSAVIMKNVGLNACADPIVNATTQGLSAGVVIIVGDDLEAKGSQNTQDSRYYGEVAQIPVIEPDRETCWRGVEGAFEASERFSRIALVRLTPPLLESEVTETFSEKVVKSGTLADPSLTMRGRAMQADLTTHLLFSWSHLSPLNRLRGGTIGVGAAHGTSHLVTVYPPPPLPRGAPINEYGRPFVREHFTVEPPVERRVPETFSTRGHFRTFCPHCPFKPMLSIMKERAMRPICDMGCAILAINPPFSIGIGGYGLGSSVAVAAHSTKVALCGDYALLHSGINGLIDAYEKRVPLLCIVMKNERMGMVGEARVYDPVRYISWTNPIVCAADDREMLKKVLEVSESPRTVVVEGRCPDGERHEVVEC